MNYYLCHIDNKIISIKNFYPLNEKLTINYPSDVLLPFKVDERILLAQHAEGIVLPYEFSIVSISRTARTLVLSVSAIYQDGVPLATLRLLLPERMLSNYAQLTNQQVKGLTCLMHIHSLNRLDDDRLEEPEQEEKPLSLADLDTLNDTLRALAGLDTLNDTLRAISNRFDTIAQLIQTVVDAKLTDSLPELNGEGGLEIIEPPVEDVDEPEEEIFEESEVLDYIKDYICKSGYYFDEETLYNYHICLKTRPFVILAGLSGTGKSKLAQLYAEALGQDGTFKRLPVRPNWNDDRYLLGHLNTVTGDYVTEPAAEFILAANANQKKLYSLCLDEMNLAHVEYYFSQFLSAMEGDRPKDRRIELMSERAYAQLRSQSLRTHKRLPSLPAEMYLTDNLIFTGTINADETTQPISDKVIDRANTIEFFNVDLERIPEPGNPGDALPISNRAWQSYRATQADHSRRGQIIEINKILQKANMGLGYRVVHEIELYLANSQGLLSTDVAFDLQCKQRILPRIRGTESIDGMLGDLMTFSKKNNFDHTAERLKDMKDRLKQDGYTSFWR